MNNSENANIMENYTLEKHLKNVCSQNHEYIDLYATWELDKKTYNNMLISVVYNYPHFSMHEGSHSKSIISNIEMILGANRIKLLGPTDTWMILESAYLHDLGMLLKNKSIEEEWEKKEFQDFLKSIKDSGDIDLKEAAEFILNFKETILNDKMKSNWPIKTRRFVVQIVAAYFRGKHAKLSKQYINNSISEWGIDLTHNGLMKNRLFKLIGEISFLHGENFIDILKLNYRSNGMKSDYIHPRFIAEMIRLGDLLDLDNNRFNSTVNDHFGELPKLSKYHMGKHAAITHILIAPDIIEASADCLDDDEVRETRKWFDMLKNEVNNLTVHWTSLVPSLFSGYAPKIGQLNIDLKGEKTESKEIDLKFTIQQNQIFDIIEGTGIYESKLDFLRELVQNALDASKIQFWRDLKSGVYDPWIRKGIDKNKMTPFDITDKKIYDNYRISIQLEAISNKKIRVKIIDRGIGFGEQNLKNMSNIGSSWHKRRNFKKELEEMPSWLKPTGGFGIGIQSCFMVTDEINIKTKATNEESKIIKLKSGKHNGYITVEKSRDEFQHGTEVIVDVPGDLKTTYSYSGYVAEKLNECDYFENNSFFDIWSIIEYISEKFVDSLFKISLNCNEDPISYPSLINNYYDLMKNANTENERYLYYFSENNINEICIWDKIYSTFIKLTISNYLGGSPPSKIFFKGVEVKNTLNSSRRDLFCFFCNINGMNTVDILTLNRKEIRNDAIPNVNTMIDEALCFALKQYEQSIFKDVSKSKKINTLSLRILHDIYLNKEPINSEGHNILIENCDLEFNILEKKSEQYEESLMSCKKFLKEFPKINFIDMSSLCYHDQINGFEKKYYDIKNLLCLSELEYKNILIDERLTNLIIKYYPIHELKYVGDIKNRKVYIITVKNTNVPVGIDADNDTINSIIKNLSYKEVKRIAICSLQKYKSLSIKTLPYEVVANCREVNSLSLSTNNYFTISPVTNGDYKELRNCFSKEEFKLKIKNRTDFINLVDYTFNNRSEENNSSKQEIINDYMRLIEDYYENIIRD